ncbi:MAG TPA: dienelactone hydrolase family protein [bacterium]|jgi:dienelactone hydrolase
MRNLLLILVALSGAAGTGLAKVKTETVQYKDGDTVLEGYLAYDDSVAGKRPGVLVCHEWWGLVDYPKHRAEQLAGQGYVAFALDMYGKGVTAKTPQDAQTRARAFYTNRPLMRQRAQAGLEVLKNHPLVDTRRIAAIGYCFGGTAALELARSGADLAGVVTFHGNLSTPTADDAKNIKGKVLICTGADDQSVKPEDITAFEDEMRKAKVDYQINVYGDAVHGFTNPAATGPKSGGYSYNALADRRSWEAMQTFFNELFK